LTPTFPAETLERARRIRLLVLDADGVLTDGRLYYSASGEELKAFDIQDGLGLKMLQASGVEVAIVTGRTSGALEARARNLGVARLFQGVEDKLAVFARLLGTLRLTEADAACMGDDLPDLPVLKRCGFALTVPAAPALVRQHAHYVTQRAGGRGAVREACELIMHAQDTLQAQARIYLR
jgi:3-deoxy-D-manno-octulosonate 8-phosphate phosphatase (KDO 8-P phosphatase)